MHLHFVVQKYWSIPVILDGCTHHETVETHVGCVLQVINHGIAQPLLDKALDTVDAFFCLPSNEKLKFMSNDVHEPVRYCTSLKDSVDKIQFWRVFLKHYANPLKDWVESWPNHPTSYRYIIRISVFKLQNFIVFISLILKQISLLVLRLQFSLVYPVLMLLIEI